MRLEDVEEIKIEPIAKKDVVDMHRIDDLPSRFKLYPFGTEIYGRPLTVREVKKLATLNEHNFNSIIKEILSNCIKGIDVDDILVGDKLYLIFWLRANTYKNSNFVSKYVCEDCGAKGEYKFDVDMFNINYLSEDLDTSLTLKLLNKNSTLEFDFTRLRDEDKVERFLKLNAESLARYDEEVVSIAAMVKTIAGKTHKFKEVCDFINKLDPEDYSYLRSFVLSIDFGIDPVIETTCKECGGVNSVRLKFQPEFFLPNYKF